MMYYKTHPSLFSLIGHQSYTTFMNALVINIIVKCCISLELWMNVQRKVCDVIIDCHIFSLRWHTRCDIYSMKTCMSTCIFYVPSAYLHLFHWLAMPLQGGHCHGKDDNTQDRNYIVIYMLMIIILTTISFKSIHEICDVIIYCFIFKMGL